MELGKNAHTVFLRYLQKKTFFDRFVPRNFPRPMGGIVYFLNDDVFETKIYFQNYFALLADSQYARARWSADVYSSSGKKVVHKEGIFVGAQGAVIEIRTLGDVGEYGVVHVSIEFDDTVYKINKPPLSIFYVEYARRGLNEIRKIISHSLGTPVAGVYSYERSFTGIIPYPKQRPYLLIANGSLLKADPSVSAASGILEVTNINQQTVSIVLPNISESLGSRKIDLLEVCPNLLVHVGDKPFSLKIKGKNILSKPFLFMLGEHVFLGDHL